MACLQRRLTKCLISGELFQLWHILQNREQLAYKSYRGHTQANACQEASICALDFDSLQGRGAPTWSSFGQRLHSTVITSITKK